MYAAPAVAVQIALGWPSSVFFQHQCVPASQWCVVGDVVGASVGAGVGADVGALVGYAVASHR